MIGMEMCYRGYNWRGVFLETDSLLSHEQREEFLQQVFDMHLDKRRRGSIKGEGYEGHAKRDGHYSFNGISGNRYLIELDTEKRDKPSKISILIDSLSSHEWN